MASANPRPGDYIPPDRSKRAPRKEVDVEETPKTQIPVSSEEAKAEERAYELEDMARDLAPVEDYQAFLRKHKISEDEASTIVDDLFMKGYYSETFQMTKRQKVVLRTRSHSDTLRLQAAIEAQRPYFAHDMQEIMARYNLAAALQQYGSEVFKFPEQNADRKEVEELFDTRLEFVERMPDPAFYRLTDILARFDRKVAAVMREGVAENF
jgi:hypothetical protein